MVAQPIHHVIYIQNHYFWFGSAISTVNHQIRPYISLKHFTTTYNIPTRVSISPIKQWAAVSTYRVFIKEPANAYQQFGLDDLLHTIFLSEKGMVFIGILCKIAN